MPRTLNLTACISVIVSDLQAESIAAGALLGLFLPQFISHFGEMGR